MIRHSGTGMRLVLTPNSQGLKESIMTGLVNAKVSVSPGLAERRTVDVQAFADKKHDPDMRLPVHIFIFAHIGFFSRRLGISPGGALEKHYRVQELSALWGWSAKTIARLFASEPSVLGLSNAGTGKRVYTTRSIPASVAIRVHEGLSNQALQPNLARANPSRIIFLRNLHGGVAKQTRKIIKRTRQAAYGPRTCRVVCAATIGNSTTLTDS
jgi:hypothetical protein